jgi:hypothetical protein
MRVIIFVTILISSLLPTTTCIRTSSHYGVTSVKTATSLDSEVVVALRGGCIPSGYHPFGFKLTKRGEQYLQFEGSRDSDVGRFLSSLKSTLQVCEQLNRIQLFLLSVLNRLLATQGSRKSREPWKVNGWSSCGIQKQENRRVYIVLWTIFLSLQWKVEW